MDLLEALHVLRKSRDLKEHYYCVPYQEEQLRKLGFEIEDDEYGWSGERDLLGTIKGQELSLEIVIFVTEQLEDDGEPNGDLEWVVSLDRRGDGWKSVPKSLIKKSFPEEYRDGDWYWAFEHIENVLKSFQNLPGLSDTEEISFEESKKNLKRESLNEGILWFACLTPDFDSEEACQAFLDKYLKSENNAAKPQQDEDGKWTAFFTIFDLKEGPEGKEGLQLCKDSAVKKGLIRSLKGLD